MIQTNALDHRSEYYPLIEKATSNVIDCGMIYAAIPETLIKLLESLWIELDPEIDLDAHPKLEADFGLKPYLGFEYYPVSALQTPVYHLLIVKPQLGMSFVLKLLNYASECYKNSSLAAKYDECREIEIVFSEAEKVKQICSGRLWKMHRGSAPNPNVLECVLMALEKWMLEVAEIFPEKLVNKFSLFLLKNSNNVAITATVLSVVEAYPEKLFEISCILLRTKEIFCYDKRRRATEIEAKLFGGSLPKDEVFKDERTASNNLEFRKITFEQVIMNYQIKWDNLAKEEFSKRISMLYSIIDQVTEAIENWELTYQYAYYQMDLRRYTVNQDQKPIEKNGRKYMELKPQMPEKLTELRVNEKKEPQVITLNFEK